MKIRKSGQTGFAIIELALIVIIVGILAGVGYYVYQSQHKTNNTLNTVAGSISSPLSDPYLGWKTYTSSMEKLSFKYPANWVSITPTIATEKVPNSDSFKIKDSKDTIAVSWISATSGLGGACDSTVMPGAGDMACPYWYVLDKEKLSGADLYYVDGVMTSDGSTYSPWCALQDSSGILQNQSSVDYLLFMGKNNSYTISGETVGTSLAGLRCDAPVGENTIMTGTKAEATAFLATTAAKQAKLILLSAHY